MVFVRNSFESIGENYPIGTGRLKVIFGTEDISPKKVALAGDSTLDSGFWVQQDLPYAKKTHTVTHQTATALAKNSPANSYEVANFAVDGATTSDLGTYCRLDKVLPTDKDHTRKWVHQLNSVAEWQPDVVVLSVAGNNYREALAGTLEELISRPQLLLRITPEQTKAQISAEFTRVKEIILEEYKRIIDELIAYNPKLDRIVLLSQYYPSITEFTPYFIYTGFSHLARAEGQNQGPFEAVENTMNELYGEILHYVAAKKIDVVFVDVTSSLNPLGDKHSHQIEPNEQGAEIMGRLIAHAVDYTFPEAELSKKVIPRIYMTADEQHIESELLDESTINTFKVKKIEQFISENRYKHLNLLFSPTSSLRSRYENTYHAIVGKQFDDEYRGLFAFGLLDLSLITVAASYLYRVALDENVHASLRVVAGTLAAPILVSKMVVGLALMAILGLPIYGAHQAAKHLSQPSKAPEDESEIELDSLASDYSY